MTFSQNNSILGGVRIELNSTSDLNNCKDPAVYIWQTSSTTPQNAPMNVGSVVQVIPRVNKQDQVTQICYAYTNRIFFRTYTSSWSQWAEISTDIPSFYKNYADLSSLANALGESDYLGVGLLSDSITLSANESYDIRVGNLASLILIQFEGGSASCLIMTDYWSSAIIGGINYEGYFSLSSSSAMTITITAKVSTSFTYRKFAIV